jgi:hypothetical protein
VVIWIALLFALVGWWAEFRYLRYLLGASLVAIVLIATQLRGWRPGRTATGVLLASVGLASIAYLPSTVASFWNVPFHKLPFGAAFGRWSTEDYLRTVFPEKDTLEAFQRAAPPGADAISDAHERTFLTDRELSPPWEVGRLLQLHGPIPTTGDAALRRLRQVGISWAILTGVNRTPAASTWLAEAVSGHGEIVFSDRGWDLYRFADVPSRPRYINCDADLRGGSSCWTGTLDDQRGLSDGEGAPGVSRVIPVCPGRTVGVRVTTAAGGQPAQVGLSADDGDAKSGSNTGIAPAGATTWIYDTAPPGTHHMTFAIYAGAGGGRIMRAEVGLFGSCSG